MIPSRLTIVLVLLCASNSYALDIAPGTTSPKLEAQDCATASADNFGACNTGCISDCVLPENTAESFLTIDGLTVGKRSVEATAYSDFRVTPSSSGEPTSLSATVSYDIGWAGGWTLTGLFTGWNDAKSTITLTLTDETAGGSVVQSTAVHDMTTEGFIGIEIIDVGFGLDKGSAVNSMTTQVIRGHTYRLGLKVECEAKGALNAYIGLDYKTGDWGAWWNDLKVSVGPDLEEEIEKLKKRVTALENHTHTYLTGRGEGHNNTVAETSKPILVEVEEPTDEETQLLPGADRDAVPLPVRTVFLNNAPNPFNPTTTITYSLPDRLHVTINLYNAQGQLARTLVSEERDAGPHAIAFDGADLASGVYYFRLTAGRFSETRKLTLLK